MCEPTTLAIASFALTAGSAVAGAKAKNAAAKANAQQSRTAGAGQLNSLALRGTQEAAAATEQEQAADKQARSVIASARLAAGENGVAGASIDALMNATANEASAAKGNIASNLAATTAQLDSQAVGINSQTQSRISSVQPANPFATALKIGGAAVDLGSRLKSYKPAFS